MKERRCGLPSRELFLGKMTTFEIFHLLSSVRPQLIDGFSGTFSNMYHLLNYSIEIHVSLSKPKMNERRIVLNHYIYLINTEGIFFLINCSMSILEGTYFQHSIKSLEEESYNASFSLIFIWSWKKSWVYEETSERQRNCQAIIHYGYQSFARLTNCKKRNYFELP